MSELKTQFQELIFDNVKLNGFDDLSARLMSILFVHPGELSLEELSKEAGYSLSAVSTAMKFIAGIGCIKKRRKQGSKKLYFFMEKDLLSMMQEVSKRKYEKIIIPMKQKIPDLISQYRKSGKKNAEDELKILQNYQEQLIRFEQILRDIITRLDGFNKK